MRTPTPVADITLYGTSHTGAGWLALLTNPSHGRLLGTGDPNPGTSFTEAVWSAVAALNAAGAEGGLVRIFAPGGEKMAVVDSRHLVPTFGDLLWMPAPVFELSADALLAAAAEPN